MFDKISLTLLSVLLLCSGCTTAHYKAQEAYYQAQMEVIKHQNEIASIQLPDGTVFKVNQQIPQQIKQPKNQILTTIEKIINSPIASILSGGYATKKIIQSAIQEPVITTNETVQVVRPEIIQQPEAVQVQPVQVQPVLVSPEIVHPQTVSPEIVHPQTVSPEIVHPQVITTDAAN